MGLLRQAHNLGFAPAMVYSPACGAFRAANANADSHTEVGPTRCIRPVNMARDLCVGPSVRRRPGTAGSARAAANRIMVGCGLLALLG
jgi:hypothetical protein